MAVRPSAPTHTHQHPPPPLRKTLLSVMCAWFCSGRTNTELIQRLRTANVITSERVKEVRSK